MMAPATTAWFARHEFGLFWRDWTSMMTAGKRNREKTLIAVILFAAFIMHILAGFILTPVVGDGIGATIPVLVFVAGSLGLSISLMLSQALESVTRAFYAREDLDLILSSPTAVRRLFCVRISAIAVTTLFMSLLLAFAFINVLALLDGVQWLFAYVAMASMAAFATAIAIALTLVMFHTLGPRKTRFVAQVLAAVVGATFVIGIQIAAILYFGSISRLDILTSQMVYDLAPALDSYWWIPAKAFMGQPMPLLVLLFAGIGSLVFVSYVAAPRFGALVLATSGISRKHSKQKRPTQKFNIAYPSKALRTKEWTLLKRDPWLISQTLMQILYLLPPAFLLWKNFSAEASALVVLVPVLVMASGQLAGGLAWLAVSGEDAPDLVSTAPVPRHFVIRAKIEAVMASIAVIVSPLLLALAVAAPKIAAVAAIGVTVSSLSSIAIQLWFRKQARRTHFRRRQISSRAATFAEAFSSILWAGTAGIAAAGSWLALVLAVPALLVLAIAYAIAPRQD